MKINEDKYAFIVSWAGQENNLRHLVEKFKDTFREIRVLLVNYLEEPVFLKRAGVECSLVSTREYSLSHFYRLSSKKKGVCVFFETSIDIKEQTISNAISCLKDYDYRAIVSGGGKVFPENVEFYDCISKHLRLKHANDKVQFVHVPDSRFIVFHSDFCCFKPSSFNRQLGVYLDFALELALWAQKESVPVVVFPKKKGELITKNESFYKKNAEDQSFRSDDHAVERAFGGNEQNEPLSKTKNIQRGLFAKINFFKQEILKNNKQLNFAEHTIINPKIRNRFFSKSQLEKIYKQHSQRKDLVVASVASFSLREKSLENTVTSILSQVDKLYVYLNDYPTVPAYLKDDKITVFRGQEFGDISANGKVFSLNKDRDCYFFTLDDDIIYPSDYVERMVGCIEKYQRKCAVTVHGSIFPPEPSFYFQRTRLFAFQQELQTDKFVSLVGSGTFAFHTSTLKAKFEDFIPYIAVDLIFSLLAKEQKVPLVSIAREKRWLVYQSDLVQVGLYQKSLKRISIHTSMVKNYGCFSYESYAEFISPIMEEIISDSQLIDCEKKMFDIEFLESVAGGVQPRSWDIRTSDFVNTTRNVIRLLEKINSRLESNLGIDFIEMSEKQVAFSNQNNDPLYFEGTHFFSKELPAFSPVPQPKEISIGFIGGERLFKCLDAEVELLLLTEKNWSTCLESTRLEMVIVESLFESVVNGFSGGGALIF